MAAPCAGEVHPFGPAGTTPRAAGAAETGGAGPAQRGRGRLGRVYSETALGTGCALWTSTGSAGGVIPADGCVDVLLRGDEVLLAGPSTRRITTTADLPGDGAATTGVRFAPGLASVLLPLSVADVRDVDVPLVDVVGRARADAVRRAVVEQVARPGVNTVVGALASAGAVHDGRWRGLVRRAAAEGRDVEEVARALGWSTRTARRQVLGAFGYPYGALVRVARSRRAHRLLVGGLPLAEAAARAGYADQPHMTREFARLVGRTPGQVAGSAA